MDRSAIKRSFSGRMRQHSGSGADDDDQIGVPVDEHDEAPPPPLPPPYDLRTNPSRAQPNKACKKCGKEFSSWKSFLEHTKIDKGCVLDYMDEDCAQDQDEDKERDAGVGTSGSSKWDQIDETTPVWAKRKRTTRTQVSSDENTAAGSLIFMKVGQADPAAPGTETEESYAASSGEEFLQENEEDNTKFDEIHNQSSSSLILYSPSTSKQVFECSTCNKVFSSHQALGGHRASHKRVKGCFANKYEGGLTFPTPFRRDNRTAVPEVTLGSRALDNVISGPVAAVLDNTPVAGTPAARKNANERVHECSICYRQFNSGQALGGHKRCHWMSPSVREAVASLSAPPNIRLHQRGEQQLVQLPSYPPPPPPSFLNIATTRARQTADTRDVRTPPATTTPTSSPSSMHNVPSRSGSGSGGVNLSTLPCMDGVASDWLQLHVGSSSQEPNDDDNTDES